MKKIHFLEKKLQQFYFNYGRKHLPWRKKNVSAYEVWVSEIMLQQTQVSRVIKYYESFLKRFPNIHALATTTWEDLLPYYTGLGYYRRGKNMLETAKAIVDQYEGKFPHSKERLQTLHGIGEYTANAILTFAYGEKKLAVDTNVKRVLGRYLSGSKYAKIDEVEKFFNTEMKTLNAAFMDFANTICLNAPKCVICPLVQKCRFFRESGEREWVKEKTRHIFPTKNAQVILWLHRDHKEYYSQNLDQFEPFFLDSHINTREKIKEYFRKHHGLELAVRPPRLKLYIEKKPTLFVNAQILLGNHDFGIFSSEEAKSYEEKLIH